jgi:signal transduction histidine kinase
MEAYERLKKLIHDVEEDVKKAAGGNKAAGTRVRKIMQDVRAAAQELRAAILEVRDAGAAPGGTPPKA